MKKINKMKEKQLTSEYIYKGNIVNLRRDTVQTAKGTAIREIVEGCGTIG